MMNKGFATILVLLVVVLVGGVGVGWYLSKQGVIPKFTGPVTTQQPPAPPPVPGELTTNETANWNMYEDSSIAGLAIKYPTNWVYKEYSPGTPNLGYGVNPKGIRDRSPLLIPDKTVFFTNDYQVDKAGNIKNIGIYLQIYKGKQYGTTKEFANKYIDRDLGEGAVPEVSPRVVENKQYAGKDFIVVTTSEGQQGGIGHNKYYFYTDSRVSLVLIPYLTTTNPSEDMLDTISF